MNPIKKSIKAIGEEPLELLRSAAKQITGEQATDLEQTKSDPDIPQDEQNYKQQKEAQDGRRLQALESELKDIRDQKKANESKAQMEAYNKQHAESTNQNVILNEPAAKKGRRFGRMGQKKAAEKQQTRVENPVQSST